MNGYKIALIAFFALTQLINVTTIGKKRTPTTPGIAAAALVIAAGLSTLVVLA